MFEFKKLAIADAIATSIMGAPATEAHVARELSASTSINKDMV